MHRAGGRSHDVFTLGHVLAELINACPVLEGTSLRAKVASVYEAVQTALA